MSYEKLVCFGQSRDIIPQQKKCKNFKIELGVPFMVPDHVYKCQMICS